MRWLLLVLLVAATPAPATSWSRGFRLWPADNAYAEVRWEDRSVSIEWSWRTAGGPRLELVTYEVGYRLTALWPRGRGTALFVAGYDDATTEVVLEEWVFDSVFMRPELRTTVGRRPLLRTTGLRPLLGVVHHPVADDLWLFEEPSPRRVYRLDLGSGHPPAFQFDSTRLGGDTLARAGRLGAAWIDGSAPDGGGFLIQSRPNRTGTLLHGPADRIGVFLMRDIDFDGVFDEHVEGTLASTFEERGYAEHARMPYP